MRVLTFFPGSEWPLIEPIDPSELDSPIAFQTIVFLGVPLWVCSDPGATEPNRIIDGHVVNGRFRVCHKGRESLSYEFAQRIRDSVDWPLAQSAKYEPEMAVYGG